MSELLMLSWRLLRSTMKLACSQSVKCLEIALLRGSECSESRVAKFLSLWLI